MIHTCENNLKVLLFQDLKDLALLIMCDQFLASFFLSTWLKIAHDNSNIKN